MAPDVSALRRYHSAIQILKPETAFEAGHPCSDLSILTDDESDNVTSTVLVISVALLKIGERFAD